MKKIKADAYYLGLWRWPWEWKIETVMRFPWNIANKVEMESAKWVGVFYFALFDAVWIISKCCTTCIMHTCVS